MEPSIVKTLITFYLLLLISEGAANTDSDMEEANCSFQQNGSCYTQITLFIIEEHVSFVVFYKNETGDSHQVLDCAWTTGFRCLKGKGYNYAPPVNETLNIYVDPTIRCVINGTFIIVLSQDIKRRCKNEKNVSGQNGSQQGPQKCEISFNSTDHTFTTSSGVECTSPTPQEDSTPSPSRNQEISTEATIGIAVGVVVIVVLSGAIIAWICIRYLKKKRKDHHIVRNRKEARDPSEVQELGETSSPEAPQQNCSTQEATCLAD